MSRNFQRQSCGAVNYLSNGINILAGDDSVPVKSLNCEKRHLMWIEGHSRSSSLSPIERACDFLVVADSILGHISHGSEAGRLTYHVSFDALISGDSLRICR